MRSVGIVAMTDADVKAIYPYVMDGTTLDQLTERVLRWDGAHWALRAGRLLVACGGLTVFWDGVAEAWLQTTPQARPYALSLYRAIHEQIRVAMHDLSLHRAQCLVREADDAAHRLMRHLGWTCEACLRQAAPNRSNLYLYALVREKEK